MSLGTVMLNNGVKMPSVGAGTCPLKGEACAQAVCTAIEKGYRLIDTAAKYENEIAVGMGIRRSGIPREQLFIISKLRGSEHGYDKTLKAFQQTLKDLQLEYLDLYLIHWPLPNKGLYIDTWKAFVTLYNQGLIRAIGVSNFKISHLSRLIDETAFIPAINQIQLTPFLPQTELRHWCKFYNILCQAWSPLDRGTVLLTNTVVKAIAAKHRKTPAQVILRWDLQIGVATIPKSAHPQRMLENLAVFDFVLSEEDMMAISTLNKHIAPVQDPDAYIEE